MSHVPLFNSFNDYEAVLYEPHPFSAVENFLNSPFFFSSPGISEEEKSYHSDLIDALLGFQVGEVESELLTEAKEISPEGNLSSWGRRLHEGAQTWIGLHPHTLQTPYHDLWRICQEISPPQESFHVVDLGAAYGRLGIVLGILYPQASFLGHELVKERVIEGNRIFNKLNYEKNKLVEQDLTSANFHLPSADVYFVYDYGSKDHMKKTLEQLSHLADQQHFQVVARGQGCRSLIEHHHPWLADVVPPRQFGPFTIYSTS